MKKTIVVDTCTKCGKPIRMGYNATWNDEDQPVCDEDAGVRRSVDGRAISPGDKQLQPGTKRNRNA